MCAAVSYTVRKKEREGEREWVEKRVKRNMMSSTHVAMEADNDLSVTLTSIFFLPPKLPLEKGRLFLGRSATRLCGG